MFEIALLFRMPTYHTNLARLPTRLTSMEWPFRKAAPISRSWAAQAIRAYKCRSAARGWGAPEPRPRLRPTSAALGILSDPELRSTGAHGATSAASVGVSSFRLIFLRRAHAPFATFRIP